MIRIRLLVLVLVISPGILYAQSTDSLDPKGYFPLAMGNSWEYEHDMYRPFTADTNRTRYERYQIINEDVVRDTTFYMLATEARLEDGSLVDRDTSRLWYDSTSASIKGRSLPKLISLLKCLDTPVGSEPGGRACERMWFVNRDEVYVFGEVFDAKRFSDYVWGFAAIHGIGIADGGGGCEPCTPFDDHDSWTLRYARVGDREYGVRVVQLDRPVLPSPGGLLIYPNPAHGVVAVEAPGRGVLSVYDLLGRRLREFEISSIKQQRIDLGTLAAGMYIIRFKDMTRAIVVR